MRTARGPRSAAKVRSLLAGAGHRRERGQALVELSLILPLFLVILSGMLEFGIAFSHNMTLEYATREGTRAGAALANGKGNTTTCNTTNGGIDAQIVAAVQRVLMAAGSPISINQITSVSIWKSTAAGAPTAGFVNVWAYTGPNTGPTVDGQRIAFTQSSQQWAPCSRYPGIIGINAPDSVGVSVVYNYAYKTPLAPILGLFGGAQSATLTMTDQSVMALNP